jgi:hypothetical protein
LGLIHGDNSVLQHLLQISKIVLQGTEIFGAKWQINSCLTQQSISDLVCGNRRIDGWLFSLELRHCSANIAPRHGPIVAFPLTRDDVHQRCSAS